MNAGRSASTCGHQLVLDLEDVGANPWIESFDHIGDRCLFQTDTEKPIEVNAMAWHSDEGQIGSLVLDIQVQLPLLKTTDLVDLTNGRFMSKTFKPSGTSSAYFVVTESSYGPTSRTWWGGARTTWTVPHVSSGCGNARVTASIEARQKRDCANGLWQANAGRSASDCSHQLALDMDDRSANPWLDDVNYQGCVFQTESTKPVHVNAFQWHGDGDLMGWMGLDIRIQVGAGRRLLRNGIV